jgi:hypothetical protein
MERPEKYWHQINKMHQQDFVNHSNISLLYCSYIADGLDEKIGDRLVIAKSIRESKTF